MPTLSFLAAPRSMTALLLLAGLSAPAMATIANPAPAPTPAPAPSNSVQGPPDGLIAPPSATPTRPSVIIPPVPAPTPAPAPVRLPTPAPAANAPANTPPRTSPSRTASPPAPVERPVAERPPAAQPGMTTPSTPPIIPPTMPAPDATAPAPLPANPATDGSANVVPEAAPTPAAPSATPLPALPGWLPWAAGGGLLLLGAGAWQWRRRRKADAPAGVETPWSPLVIDEPARQDRVDETIPQQPAAPAAAPLPAAAATRAPTRANALGRRADISLTLEPLSAQSTLVNLRLRYAVTVRNDGVIAAAPVAVRVGMFAGGQAHPAGIANWFTLPLEAGHHALPLLEAGEEYRFEGEMAAPLDALKPMEIEGRRIAIPLVAVDVRYGHAEGEAPIEGQTARAFVVGRDSGQANARLSPFRLDRGPGSFAPLGQRDTGIGHVA